MDVLQLLGQTDGFLQVYAHTEGIAAMTAALEGKHLVGTVGRHAQHLVHILVGIVRNAGISLEGACAEGALRPLVVNANALEVLSFETDGCLC